MIEHALCHLYKILFCETFYVEIASLSKYFRKLVYLIYVLTTSHVIMIFKYQQSCMTEYQNNKLKASMTANVVREAEL
jgi:hypothetical protein